MERIIIKIHLLILCALSLSNAYAQYNVTSITLVNSVTNNKIRDLQDNDTIYMDEHVNIQANISGDPAEVQFCFDSDRSVIFSKDTLPPFSLLDDISGDFPEWNKSPGSYGLCIEPQGAQHIPETFHFTVIKRPVRITSLTLINSDNNTEIRALRSNDTIYMDQHVNIRANTYGSPDEVLFYLDSARSILFNRDTTLHFALVSDKAGDYPEWNKKPGDYSLYVRAQGENSASTPFISTLKVMERPEINKPEVNEINTITDFILVNSNTNQDLRALNNGDTIYTDEQVNIRAEYSGNVAEVMFLVNGFPYSKESIKPFAFAGDNLGNYNEWFKNTGTYSLKAMPNPNTNKGKSKTIKFHVVTRTTQSLFTLIDSDRDKEICPLHNGQIIDLSSLPSPNINIRYHPVFPGTESVYFNFTLNTYDKYENGAPYALFSDLNGDYQAWNCPKPGTYTLSAKPYTAFNGKGHSGSEHSITFHLLNYSDKKVISEVFPNSEDDNIIINNSGDNLENATIQIIDLAGKEHYSGIVKSSSSSKIDLANINIKPGIYLIKSTTSKGSSITKIVKR